ncbi:MAG: exodeoxyribonuclease VII large subunit [Coriobacteriia bacterium]|nr:MAG: exodeoxyribonuclease VII large subunit [Coriobacteriia bacterium]
MEDSEQSSAYTVTQAMNAAKRGLEKIRLTVIGEVSEFNDKPGYKAAYFTVHDDDCSMPCLMWRDRYNASGVTLQAGMLVELTGNFSCYPAKGRLQFSVASMQVAGEGKLRMQVAQLARKLEAEGLMDASRKRRVPPLPQRIAVVTSPRGKAVHDVIRTLRRRYPLGELLICGVPVEGQDAPARIIQGLEAACAATPAPDVILLVRGGGSYEDLMPFNDESLARAVAASPIPVVTGIGHEPDNSICDMVSDRRCSTPTAAAEAIALSTEELSNKLANAQDALRRSVENYMQVQQAQLDRLLDRPLWHDTHYLTGSYFQTLDAMEERLLRAIPDALRADAHALELLKGRLLNLGPHLCDGFGRDIALCATKLDALSPLKTLSRGYSITYAADGHSIVDSVQHVNDGDHIQVQVQDGRLACTVNAIEREAHV